MKYTFAARRTGAAKWALLMSAIGFTYALITSVEPSVSATSTGVSPYVLGTNGTRLPAAFVTSPDLGSVIVGSSFTRQILVRFGFRPHLFTLGQFTTSTGIGVSIDGKLTGNLSSAGKNLFQINVKDSTAGLPQAPISQVFSVNAVSQQFSEAPLHFETGVAVPVGTTKQNITLPTAVSGDSYFYTIAANGGVPPYTFTLIAATGTRFLPQGLAFDYTHALIYGKPALPTPLNTPATIQVDLQDASGSLVHGIFSLAILKGTISSQAVATAGTMKLNYGNTNLNDSLSFSLLLDKSQLNANGIRAASDLKDLPIQMNFGGFTLPPAAQPKSNTKIVNKFNSAGVISVPPPFKVVGDPAGPNVKDVVYVIKLDPVKGVLTASFKNISMIKAIGANFTSFEGQDDPTFRGPVIPINIKIGLTSTADLTTSSSNILDTTDLIKFVYKRTNSFGQGTAHLNDNLAPAGIFLINKVTGTEQQVVVDAAHNITQDRLFLKMTGLMRQPGAGPVIPALGDTVSVFINRLNLGTFPASSFAVNGSQLSFSSDDPTKGLKQLVIDNKKGTVLIATQGIAPSGQLFGTDILLSDTPETVPITLQIGGADPLTPTFDGQSTVTLFRKGNAIVNK